MTISGLGSARTPRPSPTTPPVRTHRPEKSRPERNDFASLTDTDRELIFQVTGQRVGPGFDPARESTTSFAASLAAERAAGHLTPGQDVTAVYLKDLSRRYDRAPGANPIAPYLDKALTYLARTTRRVDVSA